MKPVVVFQNRLHRIRHSTAAGVTAVWDHLPDHHKERAEPFAAAAVPIVTAGQMLAARTTGAYLARHANITPPRINPARVTGAAVRRGVDPHEVYQRPFGIMWSALAEDLPLQEAKQRGRERLSVLAATDVFLAMRATFDDVGQTVDRITGWVRVADGGACDLCAAADGAPYDAGDDMAGHLGCGCTLEPVYETTDSEAADPEAIATHDNDEVGAVLYAAGDHFEGS